MMTTIVGIIISTADSYLLVPTTTLIRDIYLNYVNKNANEKTIVFLSRGLVVVLGVVVYIVSLGFQNLRIFRNTICIHDLWSYDNPKFSGRFLERFYKTRCNCIHSCGDLNDITEEASFVKAIIPNGIYATMDEVLPAIAFSVLSLVFVSIFTRENHSAKAS